MTVIQSVTCPIRLLGRDSWKLQPCYSLPYPNTFSICWTCFYNNYRQLFQITQSSKPPSLKLSPDAHTPLHSNLRQPRSVGAKPCLIKATMVEKYAVLIILLLKAVRWMAVPKPYPDGIWGLTWVIQVGHAQGWTASCSFGGDRTELTIPIFPAALTMNQHQAIHT